MKSMIMSNRTSARRLRLESLEERTLLAVTAGLAEPAAALAAPTGAANWVVNTNDDPSSWDETDAVVSLREAIGRASEGDTVTFDASLANRTITLSGSQLEITKPITIDASSIGGITIDGDNVSKIFLVTGGSDAAAVELVSLILYESGIDNSGVLVMTDCSLLFPDPGIDNSGVLVMTGCSVENSFAERAVATVANTGSVSMTDCSFTNGMGRAIYNGDTGQMTMLRCEVSDCEGTISDDLYGGAVYNGGTLTMADCSVDGNFVMAGVYYHPHDGYGGGIYNGGTLTMTNCSVSGNTIPFATHCYGGGIYNGGTLIMTNCSVSRNHDRAARQCYGAGIYNAWSGTVTMTNCTMSGNKGGSSDVYNCDVYGGGVYNSGTMEMTSCTVSESVAVMCGDGKDAVGYGGGIYSSGTLTMTNCAVVRNRVESGDYDEYYYRGGKGGGIYSPGTLTLTNCTVAGNSVEGGISGDGMGGGIYNSGTVNLYNTIIAQNTASSYGNDVYRSSGSYAYNTLSSFTGWTESENCLTYDSSQPLFTDAAGGDYTLAANSQAIDKGNNTYVTTETDLAGNPRIAGGIVDLGAYEYQSGGGQTEQLAAPAISTGSRGVYVSHGANRHQIQWSAVANASGYELAYSADGVRWTTVSASGTGAVVTGLTYGADVTYRVRALGTGSYTDSDWSAVKVFNVCPMDINGDGDIAGSDRTIMATSWLAEEGDDEYRYYADINGDGEVSNTDRPFIGQNWNKEAGDDDLVYPRPVRAADAVFAVYESGGIDVDLNIF